MRGGVLNYLRGLDSSVFGVTICSDYGSCSVNYCCWCDKFAAESGESDLYRIEFCSLLRNWWVARWFPAAIFAREALEERSHYCWIWFKYWEWELGGLCIDKLRVSWIRGSSSSFMPMRPSYSSSSLCSKSVIHWVCYLRPPFKIIC